MSIVKASPSDAGCYVNGHWGQYAGAAVISLAASLGYSDSDALDLATRKLACYGPSNAPELTLDEHESLDASSDDAESWLNDHVAPDGYSFGWHDGEFFLQSDAWWQE